VLKTWEEMYSAFARRMGLLELEQVRVKGFVESSERLQDPVNRRLADRITALERWVEDHQ
jgi:hypothetical protein